MTPDTVFTSLLATGRVILTFTKECLDGRMSDEEHGRIFDVFLDMLERKAAETADPDAMLMRFTEYHARRLDNSDHRLLFIVGAGALDRRKKRKQA